MSRRNYDVIEDASTGARVRLVPDRPTGQTDEVRYPITYVRDLTDPKSGPELWGVLTFASFADGRKDLHPGLKLIGSDFARLFEPHRLASVSTVRPFGDGLDPCGLVFAGWVAFRAWLCGAPADWNRPNDDEGGILLRMSDRPTSAIVQALREECARTNFGFFDPGSYELPDVGSMFPAGTVLLAWSEEP